MWTAGGLKVRLYIAGAIALFAMVALLIRPGEPTFVGTLTLALGYIFGAGDGASTKIRGGKAKAPPLVSPDDEQ